MIPPLDIIAGNLEAKEETIIFNILNRAQYRYNPAVYDPGKSGFAGFAGSLFDKRLMDQEMLDAGYGRFTSPEERPFNRNLASAERDFEVIPTGIILADLNQVNLTAEIRAAYLSLVPRICGQGEDKHFGSSAEHDVAAFRAISERIHYGVFYVAERKFLDHPEKYTPLIESCNPKGLTALLTRSEVEERILRRVMEKVNLYQSGANPKTRKLVDPDVIAAFYREHIIPLTKKGEVQYLLSRKLHQ